jgi:hypothetical protein
MPSTCFSPSASMPAARQAGLFWLAPIDGIGRSVIVFETKEQAEEAVAYPLPPLPGVTPLTVEIREVYASARTGSHGPRGRGQSAYSTGCSNDPTRSPSLVTTYAHS